jgi:glycosyltransferase involved in cell wall biosynthesis
VTAAREPFLSVVVPCLDARATIERALDSIDAEVEVVVIDGGSTDGTQSVLEARPGLRWISEPDRGLSDAFNKGARRARGQVLGWLNADDAYVPGALALVEKAFHDQPASEWLTGRCPIVDGRGDPIRRGISSYKDVLLRRYSLSLHLTQNFVSAPATFFRRDAFLEVGGMDESLRYSMDYDLYLRLAVRGRPIVLDEPLATFTMTPGTLSMTGFERQFEEHRAVAHRYRQHGRVPAALNAATSKGIVLSYRAMRAYRARRT